MTFRLSLAALLAAGLALAHVTVSPKEASAGATQKYTMRVPNEKAVANTRIEVMFPAEAEVTGVDEASGWKVDVKKDAAGKITGAVWTGSLEAKGFAELTFTARNPKEGRLVWKAVQVYSDGSKSEWTGAAGSKSPAPVTTIKP
jgi:uncharacterized protein YcnI